MCIAIKYEIRASIDRVNQLGKNSLQLKFAENANFLSTTLVKSRSTANIHGKPDLPLNAI